MKKRGLYSHYTAAELAQETRRRGLEKPDVLTLREWADWLESAEASKSKPEKAPSKPASKSKE